MITLPELRAKALHRYRSVLRAHLTGEELFPLVLPVNKTLDRRQGADHIHAQQAELLRNSKNKIGYGYWLEFKLNAKTRQSEISRIAFNTLPDFLGFIDKQTEYKSFVANAADTVAKLPELLPLLLETPKFLLDHAADWPNLLVVCEYFKKNPKPNLHVRSLPLDLPTKFVEQHKTALRPLLEWLIPDHVRTEETDFFRRFCLLLEEPNIKLRFLDAAQRLHPAVSQMSVLASEFRQLNLAVRQVYIIENLTPFLTFPPIKNAVAIWGGGFAVSLLAGADWISETQLFYWGDIDVHGFQILAALRKHFPSVQSLLMDMSTFDHHYRSGQGGEFQAANLALLQAAEQQLYQKLLTTNARLEQEHLPVATLEAAIAEITWKLLETRENMMSTVGQDNRPDN